MKRVLKLNRVLRIHDDQLEGYLAQGYVEVDEKGEILTKPQISVTPLPAELTAEDMAEKLKAQGYKVTAPKSTKKPEEKTDGEPIDTGEGGDPDGSAENKSDGEASDKVSE